MVISINEMLLFEISVEYGSIFIFSCFISGVMSTEQEIDGGGKKARSTHPSVAFSHPF